ncbi:pentapeptide repeat-containing protein [Verrucomicrobiales bacterium]|nr:pentapeptide repeat-containing protein [Verrucomicrobiales bacterium]
MHGVDFKGASVMGANLANADFTEANLYKVILGFIVGIPKSLPNGWMLSIEGIFFCSYGADLRTANLTNVTILWIGINSS